MNQNQPETNHPTHRKPIVKTLTHTIDHSLPLTGQRGFVRAAFAGVAMNERYSSIPMSQRPAASSDREDDWMHPGKGARR